MYLSKGGRLTLIKSTLSNLPTYFLSLFSIPASVATRIEKLQRDFLFGGGGVGDEFKFHLVKWKQVCRSISGGGLGVRNLRVFNRALLGKWLWGFAREPDSLWKLVIEKKYGGLWGDWCTREVNGAHGVGLWKHIRRGWEVFNRFVRIQVGIGTRIKFWSDVWCDSRGLKDLYPSLFQLASVKDLSVANAMEVLGGRSTWNINFGRAVQDWEINSIADFYSFIYSIRVNSQQEDVIWWVPARKDIFSVKTFYKALTPESNSLFPWRKIWRRKAPPKASFFVWTASLGKILTTDNLRKRRIIIADWCCICKGGGESVNHLLLHCDVARTLWNDVFARLALVWMMPKTVEAALASWPSIRGRQSIKAMWKMIPICILWSLWRERNDRTFEDKERSIEELKFLVFRTLYSWAFAVDFNGLTFRDFLASNELT
ncbi:hypothetical protein I3760_05G162800 [Carya illinoinensis]|nr:hypothetical protein I3760_05G162800 [Carya illinoinensis]